MPLQSINYLHVYFVKNFEILDMVDYIVVDMIR